MKYRKRPVVIEAHRIGEPGWPNSIWEGVNQNKIILNLDTVNGKTVGYVDIKGFGDALMRGEVGDWIIRNAKGEFYFCEHNKFVATYDPVEEA